MTELRLRWDHDAGMHVKDAREILAWRERHQVRLNPDKRLPVLDLGAHIGAFTCLAALAGHHVVAVEADPVMARWLRKNVLEHGVAGRVVIIEAAVAAKGGETRVLQSLAGGQNSIGYRAGLAEKFGGQEFRVPTLSFEALAGLHDDWDMLKCDVEGAEWEWLLAKEGFCSDRDGRDYDGIDTSFKRFRYVDLELHPLTNRDFFDGDKGDEAVKEVRERFSRWGFEGPQEPHPLMIRKWRSK